MDALSGNEGGRWRVCTQGSSYVFDLDEWTVTRFPGPTSRSSVNDTTRPIRRIVRCRVGANGYWTMEAGVLKEDEDAFYWASTSVIRCIERMNDHAGGSGRTEREPM